MRAGLAGLFGLLVLAAVTAVPAEPYKGVVASASERGGPEQTDPLVWLLDGEPFAVAPMPGGGAVVSMALGPDSWDGPSLHVIDADGDVRRSGAVSDLSGTPLRPVAAILGPAGGLYVSTADEVLRLDRELEVVWRAPAGAESPAFGRNARSLTDTGAFLFGVDIPTGRLLGYDRETGRVVRRLGASGMAQGSYLAPLDVAADGQGRLWVADYGNQRLVRTTDTGVVDRVWPTARRPLAVAADDQDRPLALLDDQSIVLVDPETGRTLLGLGGWGREPGRLRLASDIAWDPSGAVLVADRGNRRIQRLAVSQPEPRGELTREDGRGLTEHRLAGGRTPGAQSAALIRSHASSASTGAARLRPADLSQPLLRACPGQPATLPLRAHVPGVPPKLDLLLMVDTTGSMGPAVSVLNRRAAELTAAAASNVVSPAIGVLEIRDYPYGGAGLPTDWPTGLRQVITPELRAVETAVGELRADGGGDAPEAYARALLQAATDPWLGWRPDSHRVAVLIGDAVPRDDDLNAGVADPPVPGPWSPGSPADWLDSGPDWAPYTSDDIDWQTLVEGPELARMALHAVVTGAAPPELSGQPGDLAAYWAAWLGATRRPGSAQVASPEDVPEALERLAFRPRAHRVVSVTPGVSPGGRRSWVSFEPASLNHVEVPSGGTDLDFTATLEAPDDTLAGRYPMTLTVAADGIELIAMEAVLDWRPTCDGAPTTTPDLPTQEPTPTTAGGSPTTSPTETPFGETPTAPATPDTPTSRPTDPGTTPSRTPETGLPWRIHAPRVAIP